MKTIILFFSLVFMSSCVTSSERESVLREARAQRLHDIKKVLNKVESDRKNYVKAVLQVYSYEMGKIIGELFVKLAKEMDKELEGVKAENFYNIYKAYQLQKKEIDKKIQREVSGKHL